MKLLKYPLLGSMAENMTAFQQNVGKWVTSIIFNVISSHDLFTIMLSHDLFTITKTATKRLKTPLVLSIGDDRLLRMKS